MISDMVLHGGGHVYFDLVLLVVSLCFFIPAWVFVVMGWQVGSFNGCAALSNESSFLEFFWTFIPTFIVGVLCLFNLQFIVGEANNILGSIIKVVGRQWYWNYELVGESDYDSIMTDLLSGVDKPLRVFYGTPCNLLVTSADVIHSFSIPDYGIKVDAIPGRVNQALFFPDRIGIFAGYCTELCGAGHAYMPVILEVLCRQEKLLKAC